ncbi:hypothetical protein [Lysinibacillus sp. G4S2]|uniref:hypothetical protein n=1 Tax=Lysinibacillus sp. G4S2 TaxID=3055859 RepID=UPI0025A1ED4A|nr:hypothetical protein [Lysinibacillus sp. G4S2]MDM5248326.1 hypothetical protein [Lysinibacillus sp. G4S2]
MLIKTAREDKSLLEQKTKEFEEKMKMEQVAFIEEGLKKATTLQDVEKVNLVMISSSYKTLIDDFFTFNKHGFYYYDVNKNEFVPNKKVNTTEEVKEFEKKHKEDTILKDNPINTLILFIFLGSLCIIPLFIIKRQKRLGHN